MNRFAAGQFGIGVALCALGIAAVLVLTYLAARRTGRHSVIDVAWGVSFAVVALVSFGWSAGHGNTGQRVVILVMTAVWGLRLGGYIGSRQRGAEEDPRYTDMLDRAQADSPGSSRNMLAVKKIYRTQGLAVLFISLPVQVACYERGGLGVLAYCGIAVWAVGVFFEGVGDYQMQRFKADAANKGTIMNRGLWSLTRHPNYFGDACVWWGLSLIAFSAWPGVLTVLSPLLMTWLLAKGTGKPLLEKDMSSRRPGYADYVRRTSGFVPLPPKKSDRPEETTT